VDGFQPATTEELLRYCYGVAGCVGVMMAIVMGVPATDHATLARASDLGLAFQLNNIARDVAEDAANGRLYLPADALEREGVAATPNGVAAALADEYGRRRVFAVVRELVGLAERYEASAGWGVPALPWRSAWAVLSAARIYGDIGRNVRAAGPEGLATRTVTSKAAKLKAVAAALPAALGRAERWRGAPPSRTGYWTPVFAD
jgi:phytoene synthase